MIKRLYALLEICLKKVMTAKTSGSDVNMLKNCICGLRHVMSQI